MPLLQIQTNQPLDNAQQTSLLMKSSAVVAQLLSKPEQYVMVNIQHNPAMLFGGSDEPLAYLELKSIGLPEAKTTELSAALADLLSDELGLSPNRIYIEFADAPRSMWGWNGGTF